jgi:hypothetical protein
LIIFFSNASNKWATGFSIIGILINIYYLYKKQPDQNESDTL